MRIGDILSAEEVKHAVSGCKYVYHFAGIADIAESTKRPIDTVNLNVVGTTNIVQAVSDSDVKRFIYASTMYVYSPYGSFYRATKQAAESIIEVFSDQLGVQYTFLRYGSLYGPRAQNWNGLRKYIQQILTKGYIDYSGTGKERREYIHVVDAAKLSVEILDEKYINKAITLTGHQMMYSDEMMDMIFEIAGKKKKVNYTNREGDPDHYTNTPYRFTPKSAIKLVPEDYCDLGQGILEVIEDVSETNK
jgi:UDP-glucose 4-epimerase